MFSSHNFGHNGPIDFHGLGINGKISELQAAMGLSVLPHMTEILECRKKVVNYYEQNLDFSIIRKLEIRENTNWNYSYYPIIFKSEEKLIEVQTKLNKEQIFPRRYFYPSLNTIKYINGSQMPISEKIATCIMCLPLYRDLEDKDLSNICYIINSSIIND
jgi:dTDP-4-amino-4,6-dideoxygalactose transaminase